MSISTISSPYEEKKAESSAEPFSSVQDQLDSHADCVKNALASNYLEKSKLPLLFPERVLPLSQAFIRVAVLKEKERSHSSRGEEGGPESIHPSMTQSYIGEYEKIQQRKDPIELSDIFPATLPDRYHVIIQGRAGIGKTTLSQFVSYSSVSTENTASVSDVKKWTSLFKGVISVPLRFLNEFKKAKENFDGLTYSAEEGYFAEFLLKNIVGLIKDGLLGSNTMERAQYLLEVLQHNQGRDYLYILEGYDELSDSLSSDAKDVLAELEAKPYWILSSRPYQVKPRLLNQVKGEAKAQQGLLLELMGFIDDDIPKRVPTSCKIKGILPIIHSPTRQLVGPRPSTSLALR